MYEEIIRKAGEIIARQTRESTYCVLALVDFDGYPTVSTLTASKTEGIRRVTFCTGLNSTKARRVSKDNRASVCFNSPEHNITLTGTIKISTDPELKREMWYGGLVNHFSGPDDPNYCVLCFTTERYNLMVDWQEVRGAF